MQRAYRPEPFAVALHKPVIEQWDCRPVWVGIANGLLYSAFIWSLIGAIVWWAL